MKLKDLTFCPYLGSTRSGKDVYAAPWDAALFNEYHKGWTLDDAADAIDVVNEAADKAYNAGAPQKALKHLADLAELYTSLYFLCGYPDAHKYEWPEGGPIPRHELMRAAAEIMKEAQGDHGDFYGWWQSRKTAQRVPGTFLGWR